MMDHVQVVKVDVHYVARSVSTWDTRGINPLLHPQTSRNLLKLRHQHVLMFDSVRLSEMRPYFVDSVSQELCHQAWLKPAFLVSDSAGHGHASELCQ